MRPDTSSFSAGLAVPIPTFPLLEIVKRAVLLVPNTNGYAPVVVIAALSPAGAPVIRDPDYALPE